MIFVYEIQVECGMYLIYSKDTLVKDVWGILFLSSFVV